ncbi:hypothetical protein KIN20_031090 [Parelaphostrongylus tenuis]|uniref:Mos1 transposase HTH domain-containing protein n=1 Tax=Parelaphostrongylus tenuis TaxID=148309 RepID=A0AAD5R4U3_PARTN|nr:hypothetical protein KIN20_031090 [Parelaphostrongylus tenuis]
MPQSFDEELDSLLGGGGATATKSNVSTWCKQFREDDFDLKDMSCSGRLSALNEIDSQAALSAEPSLSTRDLAEELDVSRAIVNKLHEFDFVHKKLARIQDLAERFQKVVDSNVLYFEY